MARREDFRRIGLLLPSSNSVQEGDFWRALPPRGKPVLTTNQVSLWHAPKMLGAAPLSGLGALLREHLDDAPVAQRATG